MSVVRWILASCVALLALAEDGLAYKTDTHMDMTVVALSQSSNYLKFLQDFGVDSTRANGIAIYGSYAEDNDGRFFFHFYDPVNNHGLGTPPLAFDAAPVWGYKHDLPPNNYSWFEARSYMYKALTSTDIDNREINFDDLFRSLGQIVHLVEDMAQPSHTRNDPHSSHYESAAGAFLVNPSHMEDWAQFHSGDVAAFTALALEPKSVVSFDDPFETLALYSNQNFFSDDTIFKNYAQPSYGETNYEDSFLTFGMLGEPAAVVAEDGQIYYVPYIFKTQGAPGGYKLAQVGYFGNQLADNPAVRELAFQIDDEVAKENAQLLIPQAVSYSAGLLDYFFRGTLSVEGSALTDIQGKIAGLAVTVTNTTVGEAMGSGALAVAYQFKPPGAASPTLGLSNEIAVGGLPGPTEPPAQYTFGLDPAIPIDATEVSYRVVFRGVLGLESDAVVSQPVRPAETVFYVTVTDCCNTSLTASGSVVEVEYYNPTVGDYQTLTATVTGTTARVVIPAVLDSFDYVFLAVNPPGGSSCRGSADFLYGMDLPLYNDPADPYVLRLVPPVSNWVGGFLEFTSVELGVDTQDPRYRGAAREDNVRPDGTINPDVKIIPYYHAYNNPRTQFTSMIVYRITRTEITDLSAGSCPADGARLSQVDYTYDYNGGIGGGGGRTVTVSPPGLVDPDGIYLGNLSSYDGKWYGIYATLPGKYKIEFYDPTHYLGYEWTGSEWQLAAGCNIDSSDQTYPFPFNSCFWFLIILPEAWSNSEYGPGTTVEIEIQDAIAMTPSLIQTGPGDPFFPDYYLHQNIHETAFIYNNTQP